MLIKNYCKTHIYTRRLYSNTVETSAQIFFQTVFEKKLKFFSVVLKLPVVLKQLKQSRDWLLVCYA